MPDPTSDPLPPPPDEMTDDKVDKLVTHVLDKMGVSKIPEMALAKSEATSKLAEADVARSEQVKGQMMALGNLVTALQGMEAALHTLANAEGKIAHDVHLMKQALKRVPALEKAMDDLEASSPDLRLHAPAKKP